ncbi:MAG: DUF3500 domain-containing protein [Planctomycetes bacterium]|nr:DUF3500 domain-containing protein [Planctomycetota bacterium]
MQTPAKQTLSRRAMIKAATAGAVAAALPARSWAASDGATADDTRRAIKTLYDSFTPEQRREVCFDWDFRVNIQYKRKPLWQADPNGILLRTHLANAWLITPHRLGSEFYTDEQRELVLNVMGTTFRPAWVRALQRQARDDSGLPWGGDQALAIFGDPASGTCQCAITGFHLTSRATVQDESLAAFGGGISHGHQPTGFYEQFGHPGNIFWPQGETANQVYQFLDKRQQREALVDENLPLFQYVGEIDRTTVADDTPWDEPRRESDIRFRRPGEKSPGLSLAKLGREQVFTLEGLVEALIAPYQPRYANQVRDCLREQGGLPACSLAFYRERDLGRDGVWDNWRLEGPALTWFFRGAPHVHIWIHVARDRRAPISTYFG